MGEWVGEEPNLEIIQQGESLVLYKSFNTLWTPLLENRHAIHK
jgi:hypothetical protein